MSLAQRIQQAGLRATRKRLAISELLFDDADKHVTADDVAMLARRAGVKVSLATIYNTLNQFVAAGLLKRITLDSDRTYFDTNTSDHHHIFFETDNRLVDVPASAVQVSGLPPLPKGSQLRSIDIIVRVADDG